MEYSGDSKKIGGMGLNEGGGEGRHTSKTVELRASNTGSSGSVPLYLLKGDRGGGVSESKSMSMSHYPFVSRTHVSQADGRSVRTYTR